MFVYIHRFSSYSKDKVNYSIIKHTWRNPLIFQSIVWHIAHQCWRLTIYFPMPPNSAKWYWAMQTNTWTLCNSKVGIGKHGTSAPMYKETKKKFLSTNNVQQVFWFFLDNIKCCVNGNKKKYVMDWPILLSLWLVKIRTSLLRGKMLVLEDARFQLS